MDKKLTLKTECSKLYVIRHGQTDWNVLQKIQGHTERSLNQMGRNQIADLALKLANIRIAAIYSSPMLRAKESAEIINVHHGHEIYFEPNLKEGAFGSFEGITTEEYRKRFHKQIKERNQLPKELRLKYKIAEEIESLAELAHRAIPSLEKISKHHLGEEVIIVTHGFLMKALMAVLGDYDEREMHIENAGVLEIHWKDENLSVFSYDGI